MAKLFDLLAPQQPDARLLGAKVYMRRPDRRDWSEWAHLRSRSRDFLKPWEPTWPSDALTSAAYRRRLQRYAQTWRDDEAYTFFIFSHEDRRLVGGMSLSNVRRGVADTASVGYWIGVPFVRRGYTGEALGLLAEFSFGRLGLHRLEAACLPSNIPSRSTLIRNGFREEGYARQYLRIDGAWQDHILFALLKADWQARRPG